MIEVVYGYCGVVRDQNLTCRNSVEMLNEAKDLRGDDDLYKADLFGYAQKYVAKLRYISA